MGQYKVPQDVEAEDKILGPLTLKQFIYTVIGVSYGLIMFTLFKGVPVIFILLGIPPTLLFLMLGLYRRQDQPFEAYFLALANYFGKSRKRVWEKEPIAEVFKVEAPIIKPEEAARDPREVMGQLEKLAHIVDTRGLSSKQPEVQEHLVMPTELELDSRDRLGNPEDFVLPQAVVTTDINPADDILDFQNNPTAANLNHLIEDSEAHIREEALTKMQKQATKPTAKAPAKPSASGMTTGTAPDILKLAMESDDLTVSQIANQAQKNSITEGQSVDVRNASNPT